MPRTEITEDAPVYWDAKIEGDLRCPFCNRMHFFTFYECGTEHESCECGADIEVELFGNAEVIAQGHKEVDEDGDEVVLPAPNQLNLFTGKRYDGKEN